MQISALIPVYNGARYLREALDSVRQQTYAVSEILVVDDGSEDSTPEILAAEPGIRVIHTPHRGLAAARNTLAREAKSEWIAYLDADDLWHPDKLYLQTEYLKAHPDCELVMSGAKTFMSEAAGELTERQKEMLATDYRFLLPSALMRKSLVERSGGFNEELPNGEDTDWLIRIAAAGTDISRTVPEQLYFYRIHSGNMMLGVDMSKGAYFKLIASAVRMQRRKTAAPPKVSVIIPAWNAGDYLAEAVRSAKSLRLPEGMPPVEVIVVDDGSTDHSAEVASSFEGVKVFREEHRGPAAARNTGIRNASGEYLLFLDADDVFQEDALEILYAPFAGDGKTAASFGLAEDFISPELTEEQAERIVKRTAPYGGKIFGAMMVKKSVFEAPEPGFFDETLMSGEGIDWLLKLRGQGLKLAETGGLTVRRRLHENNLGRKFAEEEKRNYAALLRRRLSGKSGESPE